MDLRKFVFYFVNDTDLYPITFLLKLFRLEALEALSVDSSVFLTCPIILLIFFSISGPTKYCKVIFFFPAPSLSQLFHAKDLVPFIEEKY